MSRSTVALPRQEEKSFAFDPTIKVVLSETYEDPDDHDGGPPERKPLAVFLVKQGQIDDVMGRVGDRFVRVARADFRARGECSACFAHSSACAACGADVEAEQQTQ